MHLSTYIKEYPHKNKPGNLILYSTRTAALISIKNSIFERMKNNELSESEKKHLKKMGFLVRSRNKEKEDMLGLLDLANRVRGFSFVVVALNMNCNLDCSYCFEGKLKGKHYMSPKTADRAVRLFSLFLQRKKPIHLQFYGGEPLLSPGLLKSIAGRLKKEAGKNSTKFDFSFITNGTLMTKETVMELIPFGLRRAMVTIDGPKDIHNQYRSYKNGKGSFDRIIKNIRETCDLIRVSINGNFTEKNYRRFPELLDYLIAEGLTPDRLGEVSFSPVTKNRGEFALTDFNEGCDSTDEPWLREARLFLREAILKKGFKSKKLKPAPCMIEFNNDMIINYDGKIYKCPCFIGRKGLDVGDLKTGIKDYRESHKLDFWKKEECLGCAYLPICFGGCRYMKLIRDGNFDDVDCQKDYLDACLEKILLQDIELRK